MTHYLMRKRIMLVLTLVGFAFLAIVIRLGYVTFYLANDINALAFELWGREIPTNSGRGNIYDKNGELIVGNKLTLSLASINKQITDKTSTASALAQLLECDMDDILKHLEKNVNVELISPEGKKLDVEIAKEIYDLDIDGIYIVSDTSRYYQYDNTLSQTLGFVGVDNVGLAGVEYMYEEYLKSTNGSLNIYTDALGNAMPDMASYYSSSTNGYDIHLTVDINVQLIMENVINNAISRYNPDQAMGLIQNIKTGEILAISSYPNFNPESYQDYNQEIYNRNLPIWMSFEPGSTFKIVTYAAGLEEGVFDLYDTFNCVGHSVVGGVTIHDWKAGGHGQQTFLEVIENSCNPGFIEIGERLGSQKLYEYIDAFGFGEKTGVDLLGESTGIVFDVDNVGELELATSSFGQGNATTPIQLVTAASAAVNNGDLLTPYILDSIKTDTLDVIYENKPTVKRNVVSSQTSTKVRFALESVVANGTGSGAFVEGYRVGGKTGTAQKVGEDGLYMDNNYILSFLGMAPMNDPEIACYIAIDNPQDTIQYGGVVKIAPLFA